MGLIDHGQRVAAKLGADEPLTLILYDNLARAYNAVGCVPEAIALLEPTLKRRETKLGPLHPVTRISRQNLMPHTALPAALPTRSRSIRTNGFSFP